VGYLNTVKKLLAQNAEAPINLDSFSEESFGKALQTSFMPNPELLIRTSGEYRISNFMLWEMAYTEIHITEILWPDFNKVALHDAIADYQRRERRFGKVLP